MSIDLRPIFQQLQSERHIDRQVLVDLIRSAIETASRKSFRHAENLSVEVDESTWEIRVYRNKETVGAVVDEEREISLEQAKKVEPGVDLGQKVRVLISPKDFGRIAAQTAKQVIIQRIKDAERESTFNDFKKREGEIITGVVKRESRGNVLVDLGRAEGLLPYREQSPRESYRFGDRLKAYICEVTQTTKGPQIILSRSSPQLVKALFEFEVPEIYDNIIEIKSMAREPGHRTKIAVASHDPNVDPVGACVGMKGARVKAIVDELSGEKIDIVRYSDDPAVFVANALSPAALSKILIREETKTIEVTAPADQLSLAIGKKGQNARLASKLVGWKIDIKSEDTTAPTEAQPEPEVAEVSAEQVAEFEESTSVKDLPGVGPKLAEALKEAGYTTALEVAVASVEDLTALHGIGQKSAEKILAAAREVTSGPLGHEMAGTAESIGVAKNEPAESSGLPDDPAPRSLDEIRQAVSASAAADIIGLDESDSDANSEDETSESSACSPEPTGDPVSEQ